MVIGHYASALIARPHAKQAPFWLLLLSSNLAEFLWLLLALLGVEATEPASILDATFANLKVEMTYSHNLVPNLLLGTGTYAVVYFFYKKHSWAFWCALLVVLHVWCDFIVGFQHQVLGQDSMGIGLNSYHRFPQLAIWIEFGFAMACIAYYAIVQARQGQPVPRRRLILLVLLFGVGILLWLPNATMSMRQLIEQWS